MIGLQSNLILFTLFIVIVITLLNPVIERLLCLSNIFFTCYICTVVTVICTATALQENQIFHTILDESCSTVPVRNSQWKFKGKGDTVLTVMHKSFNNLISSSYSKKTKIIKSKSER